MNDVELEEVHSARGSEVRLNPQPKTNNCTVVIIVLFVLAFLVVLSFFLQSKKLMERVNSTQGSIAQHVPFYSGQLHYSRIPWQYWQHRIKMVKGMGFNAVSVYVMWNFHETERGHFDFQVRDKNLTRFLELAAENDMKVLLRPGPYVCGEWDFGGLPARLLQNQQMSLRTHDSLYESEVKIYFARLAEVIRPFLFKNGGNIILIQIQNELGSLNQDRNHTLALLEMWKDLGIDCEFYQEDASWFWKKHYWPGAHVGLSQGGTLMDFVTVDISSKRENTSLVFGGEIYTGWLTHWGQTMRGRDQLEFTKHFQRLIRANRSLSLYVAHGGTNFGLTAGANGFPNNDYMPHITSYDYDAPINEHGAPTSKYFSIRTIMKEHLNQELPLIPIDIKTISIKPFKPSEIQAYLFANLDKEPTISNGLLSYFQSSQLKMFNQGLVLYQTELTQKKTYYFNITFRDFASIYVNDRFEGNLTRSIKAFEHFTVNCEEGSCKLKVLVQAMGHINYGIKQMTDRKGLLSFTEFDPASDQTIKNDFKWNIYKVPIEDSISDWNKKQTNIRFPVLMSGHFVISSVGDTYLDMSSYKKGYLWVNGYLLGRYWDRGPQRRLYCPGVWLKNGKNEFKILQLLDNQMHEIIGYEESTSK